MSSNEEAKLLILLVREFFDDYLDVQEESDSGRVFNPIYIGCCRCMKIEPLSKLLNKMRQISGAKVRGGEMKPHKHAELIKAWADGAEIEQRYVLETCNLETKEWHRFDDYWENYGWEYRIKPEPKPEIKQMSPQEKAECDCAEFYDKPCECLKAKVVKNHVEDLKRCVKLFRSAEMDNTADEMEVAIKELEESFGLVKPEPKPDVVEKLSMYRNHNEVCSWCHGKPNLKLTFDGETGKLKSAEVLK
jgi:hypothetical protein